jgi:uncharacterized membrane protein
MNNILKIRNLFTVHRIFLIGIILKGFDGLIEIMSGFFIYFIKPETLNNLAYIITRNEITEDPNDFIANGLIKLAQGFLIDKKLFLFLFLISHGIIKIFLVSQLLKKKIWAYPLAILSFVLFLLYQLYQYYLSFSPGFLILSIIDLFVIILTWLEYNRIKIALKR